MDPWRWTLGITWSSPQAPGDSIYWTKTCFFFSGPSDLTPMNYCVITSQRKDNKTTGMRNKNALVYLNLITQIFKWKTFLGVSIRVLLDEIAFKSIDRVKQWWPSSMWVSIIQAVEDLNRIKRPGTEIQSSSWLLGWDLLNTEASDSNEAYTRGSAGSLRTFNFYNHVSQSILKNLSFIYLV